MNVEMILKSSKLFVAVIFCFHYNSKAQSFVTIPDANFVTYLQSVVPSAMSGNQMNISSTAVTSQTIIEVPAKNISNLYGVQFFTSLVRLNCVGNQLTNLPPLPNSIASLECRYNQLTALPALPNSLDTLDCTDNSLVTLPNLPNSLRALYCGANPLTSLPTLPSSLTWFSCWNTQLLNFPALPNSLKIFTCSYNPIKTLPALPNSLILLDWRSNYHLTSLPALPNSLQTLYCHQDSLTTLPTLPPSLSTLDCSTNFLTSLPPLPSSISFFECAYNKIKCFAPFSNSITSIDLSYNLFSCLPNYISAMDAATLAYPLCVSGNSNGCAVVSVEQINVFKTIWLYPNPAFNSISLNTSDIPDLQNSIIAIQNALGETVKKMPFTKTIDISELSQGCYFLQITLSGQDTYKAKFIKQ